MAGSVNKVVLIGNLGRDPEIRHTNTGKKIANFSIATSDVWKDPNGQRQEKTEWHRIVVFNASIADFVEKFLHKGSKVYIEGALQNRKWTDNAGQERYITEVVVGHFKGELVLLEPRNSEEPINIDQSASDSSDSGWDSSVPENTSKSSTDFDDEIPF